MFTKIKVFIKRIFRKKNEVEKILTEISFYELERQKVFSKNKRRNASIDNKINAKHNEIEKLESVKRDGDTITTEKIAEINRTLEKLRKKITLEKEYYMSIGEKETCKCLKGEKK